MPSTITNQASSTYQFDGSSEVNETTSNLNTIVLQDNTGLTITKTGTPTEFVVGDIITYTVTITNNSASFLTGVRIIDNLGGGNLAYVLGSGSLTVGNLTYAVSPISTNPLTFTLQQLNVGQSMTLQYRSQVIFNLPTTVQTITNNVRGIGYTSTGTIEGFDTFTIQKKTDAGVSLSKSASVTDVFPNQTFSYVLTMSNNNSISATALNLTDQLPTNFVLTSATFKIGSGSTTTLQGTDYTLTAGNLLSIPSATGPEITIPAGGSTVITLNGYLT